MRIERIDHTDGKGTALYGYRLYTLYWYDNGKTKTPHAFVCTVVQDLNKAEGYVFQNIENVTIDRGLPGTTAGMSSSVNNDTYTVAQLYGAVKRIGRIDGGLMYTAEDRNKYAENAATQVAALIMGGAGVIAYIVGEGLADAAHTE